MAAVWLHIDGQDNFCREWSFTDCWRAHLNVHLDESCMHIWIIWTRALCIKTAIDKIALWRVDCPVEMHISAAMWTASGLSGLMKSITSAQVSSLCDGASALKFTGLAYSWPAHDLYALWWIEGWIELCSYRLRLTQMMQSKHTGMKPWSTKTEQASPIPLQDELQCLSVACCSFCPIFDIVC